ncbi:hypothetical protein DRP05_10715 [Archaeoglobales archaeon]|nr:MAG: hypothetical protein DRP05_10715 [Archaeoglobales archaeon]
MNPKKYQFHLQYKKVEWQILDPILNLVPQIVEAFEEELSTGDYCGVAITTNGYQTACSKGKFDAIEGFIQEIINIAHENYLPVVLPRSGWYGLYLTDYGIQAFSSLLNGAERYTPRGGRGEPEDQYGKVPVYGICKEFRYRELLRHLKTYGELPDIPGLPRRPDPDAIGNPRKFRILFGKPWRLSHCQEAREVRDGLIHGVKSPAKRYFERSKHPHLKNI